MNTDRKFLQSVCALFATTAMFLALLIQPNSLKAEGSVDFINNDGYRLFYFAERPQQLKVYANEGEFINFGASHIGISGGFIRVYRPDGTLHSTYNGTGTNGDQAIINNNIEEMNGPTGGGSLQGLGYDPGIVEVDSGEEGVWTITLEYGFYQFTGFDNLLNNEAWTREQDQPDNRRVVLSWDITISQNAAANDGGNMQTGRVFTNEYQSILNGNGVTTSPTFYLLNNEGFQFQIDYDDVDPWGFQINSNNKGITSGDLNPTYASFEQNEVLRSADVSTFANDQFYLYEPQARDLDDISNNKVFFNLPDPNMPATALVTDITRNDTHTTWLYAEAPNYEIEILNVALLSNDPITGNVLPDVLDRNNGALITYSSNLGGNATLVIDIDNDGIFGNNNDRMISESAINGENQILWDGLDQNGQELPQQFNRELSYRLVVNAGELHLTLSDIENDNGGVTLTRLNGNAPSDEFLYDHSRLGEAVSGNNNFPELTSEPFTFSNNFGDLKILDYWTYVASVSTISSLLLDVVDDVAILPADTDGDGIRDDNDIDNDNDGILDAFEICAGLEGGQCFPNGLDPDFDEDFDGVPNYLDADDPAFDLGCQDQNGDGICDQILFALDIDQDGVPNHLDLDSDNDGIVDILEADHNFQDTDGNGTIDGQGIEFGQNGLYNPLGTDDNDLAAVVNYEINDADNDTHPDAYDLDSDNDGIYDVAEANFGSFDLDENGMLAANEAGITVSANGLISLIDLDENGNQIILPFDNDLDQIYNFRDRDSDNDGLTDAIEGRNPDSDADGVVGEGVIEVNELGVAIFVSGEPFIVRSNIADHDGDAIEDYRDLDSDNDGIYDVSEALLSDADNDGFLFTGTPNIDAYGMQIAAGASTANYIAAAPDQDGDTVANYLDRDSDNDGIHDVTEAGNEDPEGDGVIGLVNTTEVNELGLVLNQNVSSLTANNDTDNLPDYLDLDADNDGINDVIEAGGEDPEGDGKIGLVVNEFGQYVNAGQIATTSFPSDNDGDGVPNYHDLDSDNDGLNDVVEGGNQDPDNDGVVGVGNPATDINGQVIGQNDTNDSTSFPLDTDGDGIFDYEDLDSDNDGIFDVYEGNLSDDDNDGIVGVGQVQVDENGQVILPTGNGNTSNPVDTDGDGIPDFRDTDSDNDQINDEEECPNGGPCPDLDQNGTDDFVEANSVVCPVPLVTPTVTHPASICSADLLSLTVNESDAYETAYPGVNIMYIWTNANGTEIITTNDPNYNIDGDNPLLVLPLSVVVMVDEECESSPSNPVEVNVTTTPTANASAEFDNVCIGGMVQLLAGDIPGATYQWFFNNTTPFSTTQNLSLNSLNQSTNFGLEVTLNGCTSERDVVFVVADEPASIVAQIGTGEYCEGEDIFFTAINENTVLQGDLTYVLTGPDGLMVEVTVPANGTFEYTLPSADFVNEGMYSLIVDSGSGCVSNVESYEVTLTEGVEQPEIIVSDMDVCSGDDVTISTQAITGTNVMYEWILNGVTVATTATPNFMVNNFASINQGSYQVLVNTGECGASTSAPVAITLTDTSIFPNIENNLTVGAACIGQTVNLRISNPTPETVYTWFDPAGNVLVVDAVDVDIINIQFADQGLYTVEANINGCAIRTDQEEIEVSDGIVMPEFDTNTISSCGNQDVSIVINNFTSSQNTTYTWFTSNDVFFAQTTTPELVFQNPTTAINGGYYVVVELDGCTSPASEMFNVNFVNPPSEIANAGQDMSFCQSATVNLLAALPTQGTGMWIGVNGSIVDPNNPTTAVNNLPVGDNMFIWSLSSNGCLNYSMDTVIVSINDIPNETATIFNTETSVCSANANNIVLSAENAVLSTGQWVMVSGPSNIFFTEENLSSTSVDGLVPGTYEVAWQLNSTSCGVFSTDSYTFTVDALPTDIANAGEDQSICGSQVNLSADAVNIGEGVWTSTSGVIANPNDPNTSVTGLSDGVHSFTWTLSNGACGEYASDVVFVATGELPNETAEVVNSMIEFCADFTGGTTNLVAIAPTLSTGSWTQIDGPILGTITDSASENTTVTNLVAGQYSFVWTLNSAACGDFSTATVTVIVEEIPTNELADAGANQSVCSATNTSLNATNPSIGTGRWTIFNTVGASVSDVSDPNSTVTLVEGENAFVWSLSSGECIDYQQDTVSIFLTSPSDEAIVITDDVNVCETNVNNIVLNAGPVNIATGVWTQVAGPNNATIDNPTNTEVNLTDLIPGSYSFQWTLSDGICQDYASDEVAVVISSIPNEMANIAQDEIVVCENSQVTLTAGTPSESMGVWSTNGSSTIVTSNSESTQVTNLQPGANVFNWTLSSGNCLDFSAASVTVFAEEGVTAVNDNYSVENGISLTDENVLDNEDFNNNTDWTVALVSNSPEVTFNNDGSFSFVPATGFSGTYTFEYEICDQSCGICERAFVNIDVASQPIVDCDVPNVLTPNNDNKNDALIIDCSSQFENNIIQVFNRWGDKVYEQVTYQNNWRGTYNGDDLPAGTYFYVFKMDQDDSEAITGYITIIR